MVDTYSIFVVDLQARTLCLPVTPSEFLQDLRCSIQEVTGIDSSEQYIARRHAVDEHIPLSEQGITADTTLFLSARLRGGKGGFGSLLRGSGKAALTENEDACRDLSGRRLRLVNADKKLKDWAAAEKKRKDEKLAAKEERERAKAELRAEDAETNLEAIRKDQNVVLSSVAKALESSRKSQVKRPGSSTAPKPAAKKTRYSSESELDESDSESDASDKDNGRKEMEKSRDQVQTKMLGVIGTEDTKEAGDIKGIEGMSCVTNSADPAVVQITLAS